MMNHHSSNSAALRGIHDVDLHDAPLTRKQIVTIHDASMEVLSGTGFRFGCERVRKIFKKHGFRIEGEQVFFTERDILRALDTIPKQFTIRARNPAYDVHMKQDTVSFGLGRGAVHMVEPDGSYRTATKADVIDSLKLAQCMEELEHTGPLAYPSFDVDRRHVHLWQCHATILYTDKIYNLTNRHDIDLLAIAYGTTRQKMIDRVDVTSSPGHATCIVNSPLTVTENDCQSLMDYAQCGLAFHVASIPIAGTSGPCTIAGSIVLQNCENLAPIVFSQLVRPGTPAFYGFLAGHADMMSLRPRFGTAEARLIGRAGCQMAHHYGLLSRGNAGLTDAPTYGFQSGAQAMLSTLSVIQNGPNFITGCGLLGSYMGASLAKIILDVEVIIIANRYLSSIRTDRESLAVDVIHDIGPGGTFIEHGHTLQHYRSEFLTESLFQSPDYEKWNSMGKTDVVHLAHEKALKLIKSYEKPPMDPGMKEEIDAYVAANRADT